jgi:hypothetical protein
VTLLDQETQLSNSNPTTHITTTHKAKSLADPIIPSALNPRIAALEKVLSEQPESDIRHILAKAELAARADCDSVSPTTLTNLVERYWLDLKRNDPLFASALCVAFAAQRAEVAADMINRRCETDDWFAVGLEDSSHGIVDVIRCQFHGAGRCKIWIERKLIQSRHVDAALLRLSAVFPLIALCRNHENIPEGNLFLNLGDAGRVPGIAFCANRSEYFLIPDSEFLLFRGYARMRESVATRQIPWNQKLPIGYWRGGISGQPANADLGWQSLPRVKLCRIGELHSDILDVGIAQQTQIADEKTQQEVRASGLMRKIVPPTESMKFKYQVDIDGNTNAWSALFQKLLIGSAVLKVASPIGYRQWYYDRLRPWINFVPVASDMSDLVEKVQWLRANDDTARRIGENGQALAISLDYEAEAKSAGRTLAAAVRFFEGQPETEIRFGVGTQNKVRLLEGWAAPREDGLPALGHESRIETRRPVAAGSFVLTLDLSPYTDPPAPPAQRLAVVANGEIVRDAVLTERRSLRCHIPQLTLEAADQLTVTLLHPDAANLASMSHPLEGAAASVILHGLTLVPTSIDARTSPSDESELRSDSVRPTNKRDPGPLYGPDVWLPADIILQRVKTHSGSVVFADINSGTLRHGPLESSPENVVLGANDGIAYLFYILPDGDRCTIGILPTHDASKREAYATGFMTRCRSFNVVSTEAGKRTVLGLRCCNLFLCAEGDGRITLSRNVLGPWEVFELFSQSPARYNHK